MVRLVFRPYTQIRRTICTSVTLRASIPLSKNFTLFTYRSPPFGSSQICSYSNLSQVNDRSMVPRRRATVPTSAAETTFTFITHQGFVNPNTRIYVRLLGPCFKTGELKPFRQHREHACSRTTPVRPVATPCALHAGRLRTQDIEDSARGACCQLFFLNLRRTRTDGL